VRDNGNALVGSAAGVAVLIPLILTVSHGWSWWYLLFAGILLAVVVALRRYLIARARSTLRWLGPWSRHLDQK
jgi:hypothetical protein